MKTPKELTTIELLKAYNTGVKWVNEHWQETKKNINALGETYKHGELLAGMQRVQELERELQIRVHIWQKKKKQLI